MSKKIKSNNSPLESFEAIVDAYIDGYQANAEKENKLYKLQKSRGKLIEYAEMAKTFEESGIHIRGELRSAL